MGSTTSRNRRGRALVVIAQAVAIGVIVMVSVELNRWRMSDWSAGLAVLEIAALVAFTCTRLWRWAPLLVWWFAPELVLSAFTGDVVFLHAVAWSMWVLTVLALGGAIRSVHDDAGHRRCVVDDGEPPAPLPQAVARLDSHQRAR